MNRRVEEEEVKNSELFCMSKTQLKNKANKFAIETERKTLKIEEFVVFIKLLYDFS